jgi:hypothetical protein
MVLVDFRFNEGVVVGVLGPALNWGTHGLLFCRSYILADWDGREKW